MNNNEITIFLTPIDVELFKKFQQNYDLFTLLVEKRVFDQKSATVSLDFDHLGTLQTIRRNDFLYSRKHELQ